MLHVLWTLAAQLARELYRNLAMRVGIPTWDGWVSPVLDVAKHFLLVEIEHGDEVDRREADIEELHLAAKVKRIGELGVQALICGAVSWPLEQALAAAGVRVTPQTCGPVEEVLAAFLSGRLTDEAFLMPGCCGRHRRRRGQRRGQPGARTRPSNRQWSPHGQRR